MPVLLRRVMGPSFGGTGGDVVCSLNTRKNGFGTCFIGKDGLYVFAHMCIYCTCVL